MERSTEVRRASALYDQGHNKVTDGESVISAGAVIPEEEPAASNHTTTFPPLLNIEIKTNTGEQSDDDVSEPAVQMRTHGGASRMLSDARDSIMVYKDDTKASAIKAANRKTLLVDDVRDGGSGAKGEADSSAAADDRNLPLSAYTSAAPAAGVSNAALELGAELGSAHAMIPGGLLRTLAFN